MSPNTSLSYNKIVPNEVVNLTFDHDWLPMRAWREYLGLTQEAVAAKATKTQGVYTQMENSAKPRHASLKKYLIVDQDMSCLISCVSMENVRLECVCRLAIPPRNLHETGL